MSSSIFVRVSASLTSDPVTSLSCHSVNVCLTEKPSGMRDTCTSIADKVILGKEITKSVKCFQKCFWKHLTLFAISLPSITLSAIL